MNVFKYILRLTPIILIGFLLQSCSKDPVLFGKEDGVYIDKELMSGRLDSVTYSFASKPETLMSDTVFIPVRIVGLTASVDREVPLLIIKDSSTAVEGVDFKKGNWVVKANEYSAVLQLIIFRTPAMKASTLRIALKMGVNDVFQLDVLRTKTVNAFSGDDQSVFRPGYVVKANDMLTKPERWEASGSWLQLFFGNYSETKFKFIIEATGKSDWPPRGRDGVGAPTLYMFYNYKSLVFEALRLYELDNGPMYDENGVRVTFPD